VSVLSMSSIVQQLVSASGHYSVMLSYKSSGNSNALSAVANIGSITAAR
jgi:hypothetical protein